MEFAATDSKKGELIYMVALFGRSIVQGDLPTSTVISISSFGVRCMRMGLSTGRVSDVALTPKPEFLANVWIIRLAFVPSTGSKLG